MAIGPDRRHDEILLAVPRAVAPGLIAAYPTVRQAARILGVAASSLSRRDITTYGQANQKHVPASELMALAVYYNNRPLYEVAADLVDYAIDHSPDHVDEVEREIQAVMNGVASQAASIEEFFAAARNSLPREVYEQVMHAYDRATTGRNTGASSRPPLG